MTCTCCLENERAISRVRSVRVVVDYDDFEAAHRSAATSDSRQAPRQASSLRAGMITDTAGRPEAGRVAGIRRILYYSWVRRFFCFTQVAGRVIPAFLIIILGATLLTTGALSGC